jgi:hypothetical protein
MVVTFRVDSLQHSAQLFAFDPELLELDKEGHIKVNALREKSSKRDHFHCDMGIKEGEWVTVAIVYDYLGHTATFYANGKQWTIANHSIKKRTYGSQDNGRFCARGNCTIDEFRWYKRALTTAELKALCGVDGKDFEIAEQTVEQASLKMNWTWAIIQLAFAALCLLFLNGRRKKLEPVTAETIRLANRNTAQPNQEMALQHLNNAFNYWGCALPNDDDYDADFPLKPSYYPESKKNMKASLAEFNEALKKASPDCDEDFLEYLNLFVHSYNAAHARAYNGKWWIFLVAIMAVYIQGLIPEFSLGFLDNDHLRGLPDGFFPQIWYFSKYMLPGVVISAIAYYATSFGIRYRKRAGEAVLTKELKEQVDDKKKTLIIAGVAVGGGLLAIVGGAVAGTIAIIAVVAGLAYVALSIFNKHGSMKETRINLRTGRKTTSETLNPAGLMMIAAVFFGVILALYLVSSVIIFLFNVIFIYKAIQNYIIKT